MKRLLLLPLLFTNFFYGAKKIEQPVGKIKKMTSLLATGAKQSSAFTATAIPAFALGLMAHTSNDTIVPLIAAGGSGALLAWLSLSKLSNTANTLPLITALLYLGQVGLERNGKQFLDDSPGIGLSGHGAVAAASLLSAQIFYKKKMYSSAIPLVLLTAYNGFHFVLNLTAYGQVGKKGGRGQETMNFAKNLRISEIAFPESVNNEED